jgi:hypothetical protein
MGRLTARILAGVLSVASAAPIVMAVTLAFWNVALSAQQPDPTVPDGDPCCGHPDNWGEVALGFVSAAMFLLGAAAVAYLAVQLGRYGVSGRAAINRQWRRAAAAIAYIGLVLALIVIDS